MFHCKCSLISLVAFTLCCWIWQPLFSREDSRHAAIEKYLDSQTLAVGWIDISKVDVDQFADFGNRLAQSAMPPMRTFSEEARKEQHERMRVMQQALLQNKVTHIYWIVELSTLAQGPESIVVPTPNAVAVAELLKSFVGGGAKSARFVQVGDAVIGGRQPIVDALQKKEGAVSPDLTKALQSNEGPHGLVALTPLPLISALMTTPTIKSWAGDDPSKASALGQSLASLKSISLETELPPERAHLRIETLSAEAAKKTADLMNELLKSLAPEAAEQLTLTTDGTDITLESGSLERSIVIYTTLTKVLAVPNTAAHMNNMKRLGLALHNYEAANRHLPPQALTDKAGKRLLSWRVLILPYLDQTELYEQFHFDEPWDSEHNLKLAQSIPSVYDDVAPQETPPRTRIVAPLLANSAFGRPGEPVRFQEVRDGLSNTIWLVQADPSRAVVWTKPDDVTIGPENPTSAILDAERPSDHIIVGMMDGSIQTMPVEFLKKWFIPMLSINGGEVIRFKDLKR